MEQSKKKIIRLVVLICVIGMLIGVVVLLIEAWAKQQEEQIYYYPAHMFVTPDFSYNIMEDAEYLALDRGIYFKADGMTILIEDADSELSAFLISYFDAIQSGDADAYNSLFSRFYRSRKGTQGAFAMQRIYAIRVEEYGAYLDPEDDTKIVRIYTITYKISKNDGTFRRDILSDMEGAQALYLVEEDGTIKVDQVIRLY